MIWLWLYIFCLFAFTLHKRGAQDNVEFYVYGRRAGSGTVALSILASCIGGSATIGMVGLAWQVGAPGFWWLGSGVIGLALLGLVLAPRVRRSGAMTMPEVLHNVLGPHCRLFSSIIIVLSSLAIVAAQFSALGVLIASLGGMEGPKAVVFGALILVAYTYIGGQAAVMKSDIWQFAIMMLALALALVLALKTPAARDALANVSLEFVNNDFPWSRLRYFLCILGGSFVIGPMLFGRVLSARNGLVARRGVLLAAVGLAGAATIITAFGIASRGLVEAGAPPEEVFNLAIKSLPSWADTIIGLGLFSAVISSADSCLFTAASVCANDLLKKPGIAACRYSMVLVGVLSCCLALQGKGILALLLMANDIYVCGIVVPVFVGLVWGQYRKSWRGMFLLAMVSGGALGVTAAVTGNEKFSFAGLGIALAISLAAIMGPALAAICKDNKCLRMP